VTGPTGVRLYDLQSQRYQGTLTNMDAPTDWVRSSGRYCLDCDGTNDQISTAANTPATASRAVAAWVYPRSTATQWFFGSGFLQANQAFIVGIESGAWKVTQYGATVGSVVAVANTWAHIAVVNTGTTWVVYVNGIGVTGTMATALAEYPIFLGSYSGGGFWNGLIDDVAVYRRALTAGEIRTLSRRRGITYEARRQDFGSSGFQSAWARQRTQLIGGGV
jgi:hypothetical protein